MKKQSKAVWGLALVGALSLNAAQAATNTSATSAAEVAPSLKDKLNISDTSYIYGPGAASIAKGDISKQPNTDGSLGDAVQAENVIAVYYKASPAVKLGPVADIKLNIDAKKPVDFAAAWLAVKHGSVYTNGNFALSGDLRFYAPVAGSLITGIRSSQNMDYQVPNTRLTISNYTTIRANANRGLAPKFQFTLSPYLNYQISPKVAATLWTDVVQLTAMNTITNEDLDIQPGMNFEISPNFSLNPYLNIRPAAADLLGSTSINVTITATLL